MHSDTIRGLVFNVQGFTVHDGPGIRTEFFMKGCPLSCEWCSNPEGMRTYPEPVYTRTNVWAWTTAPVACVPAAPTPS